MKLPIQFGGTYHWVLRDANTNEIIQESEKHNMVVLSGWQNLLSINYSLSNAFIQTAEIVLSETNVAENETATDIPNKLRGTIVNSVIINKEEANTPKNFIYHYQFSIPTVSKHWTTIGLYKYNTSTLISLTALANPIAQLGNDSPTPQVLNLYYTLYFDYDKTVTISHSKNGTKVLGNFINHFSDRGQSILPVPDEYQVNIKLNQYAHLCKTLSIDINNYNVRDFNDNRFKEFNYDESIVPLNIITDSTNFFNKTISLVLSNNDSIGKIYGSLEVCGYSGATNDSRNRDYGIIWPITNNVNVKPIQNVFSHKQATPSNPERPFEYIFRSTGYLIFDDANLIKDALPQWYQLDLKNSGNITDNIVKFSIKKTNFLGFKGNSYEISHYYPTTYPDQYQYKSFSVGCLVYPNAIPNGINIDNYKFCYPMYNEKEVVWFDKTYVIKQNILNAAYKIAKSGTTAGFTASQIHQLAIKPATELEPAIIFAACSLTGVWIITEDFSTVVNINVSSLTNISNLCYGISIGYNGRVWALMHGGLIYSDDLGISWTIATFTCTGISDSNWNKVNKLYAGSGTNRHVLLFVLDDGNDQGSYIWFKAGSNTTPGSIIKATGYVLSNGPRQIIQVDNHDCFLVKPKYVYTVETEGFYIISYNNLYPSLYTELAYNAIDCLYDSNGNWYPVYTKGAKTNWVRVTDLYNTCEITVIATNSIKYYNSVDPYNSLILMSKASTVILQGESTSSQSRLVTRTIKPNDYTSRILDLQYSDYRYNDTTSAFVKNYIYPAIDSSANNYDGKRVNFPVENVMFMGGSYISLKQHISVVRPLLEATGECTIIMTVMPSNIDTTSTPVEARIQEVLSIQFDKNFEGTKTGSLSLQIHPEIKITNYSSTGAIIPNKFSDNVYGGVKVFDNQKVNRIALVIVPGKIKLYVNGAQLGLDIVSCVGVDFSMLSDIIFGQGEIRSFGFTGYLDFIQVWNKAFTSNDVIYDYTYDNYTNNLASVNNLSSLTVNNLISNYKLGNMSANLIGKETALISSTTPFVFDRGLSFTFEDNSNVATSYFDTDFYTFGVVDGLLKDNQIMFSEDYLITFSK